MALEIYPPSIRHWAFCLDSFYIELHTIDNLNPLSRLVISSSYLVYLWHLIYEAHALTTIGIACLGSGFLSFLRRNCRWHLVVGDLSDILRVSR